MNSYDWLNKYYISPILPLEFKHNTSFPFPQIWTNVQKSQFVLHNILVGKRTFNTLSYFNFNWCFLPVDVKNKYME